MSKASGTEFERRFQTTMSMLYILISRKKYTHILHVNVLKFTTQMNIIYRLIDCSTCIYELNLCIIRWDFRIYDKNMYDIKRK